MSKPAFILLSTFLFLNFETQPHPKHRVGIALAVGSGALIGSSFVFKKKGLLASQGDNLGEGVAYLRNVRPEPVRSLAAGHPFSSLTD